MSEATPAPNGADTQPQFAPQAVYLKDASFEAPQGPRLPQGATAPQVNMNLTSAVNVLSPDLYEVVLTINVQAQSGDKTVWLCEAQQAGAFAAQNIPQAELHRILNIFAPNYLLPFARQAVADLLLKGGFPAFLIPPVNFDALYEQHAQQAAQNAAAPPAGNPAIN